MAKKIAVNIDVSETEFVALEKWLQKFTHRNNIKSYAICGELGENNTTVAKTCKNM